MLCLVTSRNCIFFSKVSLRGWHMNKWEKVCSVSLTNWVWSLRFTWKERTDSCNSSSGLHIGTGIHTFLHTHIYVWVCVHAHTQYDTLKKGILKLDTVTSVYRITDDGVWRNDTCCMPVSLSWVHPSDVYHYWRPCSRDHFPFPGWRVCALVWCVR